MKRQAFSPPDDARKQKRTNARPLFYPCTPPRTSRRQPLPARNWFLASDPYRRQVGISLPGGDDNFERLRVPFRNLRPPVESLTLGHSRVAWFVSVGTTICSRWPCARHVRIATLKAYPSPLRSSRFTMNIGSQLAVLVVLFFALVVAASAQDWRMKSTCTETRLLAWCAFSIPTTTTGRSDSSGMSS